MLGVAGIGTVFGFAGTFHGLFRPTGNRGLPIALGLLGLIAVFGYAGVFWMENGNDSWEHARRYLIFHAVFVGPPFLSGMSAMILGLGRKRPPS